jgi:hypothetical protein
MRHLLGSLFLAGAMFGLACSASDSGGGVTPPGGGKGGSSGGGWGGSMSGAGGSMFMDAGGDQDLGDSSCASVEVQAEAVPLDLYFMLDRSASMTENYGGTMSIKALRDGVAAFLNDPASAGIYATAQIFAIFNTGPTDESCDPSVYATPGMPWSPIPYPQLATWVQLIKADGLTPSEPALQGAVDACGTRLLQEPTHKCAVIFVTDGNPQGQCVSQDPKAALGTIAAGALAKGIVTFAIGFPGLPAEGQDVLNVIAQQGGTTAPVIISGTSVGQDFIDALNKIRGQALACEYKMPALPPGKGVGFVIVRYTPGGTGTPEDLKRKQDKASCGNDAGWYYDDNKNPTKIILCPASCTVMQADAKGKVQVVVACNEQPY